MGKRPKTEHLYFLFRGEDTIHLTDRSYEEITGAPLPKDKHYIKTKSALAEEARKHGYEIVDVKDKPIIERTILFQKVR